MVTYDLNGVPTGVTVIPNAETILIPGCRHDVLNEIAPIRDEAWRQIDGFLKRIL